MNYRRALFVVELGTDPVPHVSVLCRVAPALEHLRVFAELPTTPFGWLFGERDAIPEDETDAPLEALRAATADAARSVDVQVGPELDGEGLAALCIAESVDLLVFGSRSLRSAWVASAERRRQPVAVLWSESEPAVGPLRQIACVALDEHARAEVGAFLRDHADASMQVTLLSPTAVSADVVATALEVSGIEASVEVSSLADAPSLQEWFDAWTKDRAIDLLVLSGMPTAFLLAALRTAPILLLPPLPTSAPTGQPIDVPDLVDDGGPVRVHVDQIGTVGSLGPIPDQAVAFVSGGHVVSTITTLGGDGELPAGLALGSVGVYRAGDGAPREPLTAIEQRIAVLAPGTRSLVVVDAELADETLRALADITGSSDLDLVVVRLRPLRSCRAIRERLQSLGLSPRVLDARLVLDEGEALDVSELLDPVRLARAASRLKGAGFPVSAIVHRGQVQPSVEQFAALTAADLDTDSSVLFVGGRRHDEAVTTFEGNLVEIELDNATARRWLLDTIATSRATLHFQVYMALDGEVGRQVEAALAAAAARGVTVRVLVDSLHGLHGSFGVHNPLLERLAGRPGIAVRVVQPITELPTLTDLKQRDHRKLVVADGRVGLLGGRNLADEYYTGFDEIRITPASTWRAVPWLDCGGRIAGPAVAALEASFLRSWTEAGGAPFEVASPSPVGTSSARVVVHRGLRDARTLETYLSVIETARAHILAVTGFPLLLEVQHALLRAIARGVRVRVLVGFATPTHDGKPFAGPWATARIAATELVHSRMDPIVDAGGECYLFAVRDVPGWDPEIGLVHPHVHAKTMSADGLRCVVGSANMDVTASYWESEVLLDVEDAAVARALEAELDLLMARSTLVRRDDPEWQRLAGRRTWMRHWPGVLSA